jgi:hypothetical protein
MVPRGLVDWPQEKLATPLMHADKFLAQEMCISYISALGMSELIPFEGKPLR